MFRRREKKAAKKAGKRDEKYTRLCNRVIGALFAAHPNPIEQGDLCAKTNISVRQLIYMFWKFPDKLEMVKIIKKEDWRKTTQYSLKPENFLSN